MVKQQQPYSSEASSVRFRGATYVAALVCWLMLLDVSLRADSFTTVPSIQATSRGTLYKGNIAPLQPSPLMRLPPGSIQPNGWLLTMLQTQRSGMNGRLEEISPWLKFDTSDWTSTNGMGSTQGWERVPYWLRGYIDLGYCLQDPNVISNATRWIQGVMTSRRPNGYFGPDSLYSVTNDPSFNGAPDLWPAMPMLDALRSYYDYTGDTNAMSLMRNYCLWENSLPPSNFGAGYWPMVRMGDNIESVYWLYNRLGESWFLDLAGKMYTNMARWDTAGTLPNWHNVNIAESFRAPTVYWQQSDNPTHLQFAEANFGVVKGLYGQVPGGAFGADENCRSGYSDPRQAFETCGWVEMMRSCEILQRITGIPVWAERCEDVALNSFPAALRTNMLSLHYLTAPNQVQLDQNNKSPDVQNGGTMFSYSPFEVYHCCQHNHGQGWPYFCEETWQATWDNGLCASLYASTSVSAKVATGSLVTFTETTDYPFGDVVQFVLTTTNSVSFPFYIRVPQWCTNGWAALNGQRLAVALFPSTYLRFQRSWLNGDRVTLHFPRQVSVRTWSANHNSVSVNYGPLTFSLRIGEQWLPYGTNPAWPEWECYPSTPWNYALVLNNTNPASSFRVITNSTPLPAYPFSLETAPIQLQVNARRISEWKLDSLNAVPPLQDSPALSTQAVETVTLVPMGAARLRISAFPTVTNNGTGSQWSTAYAPSASYCNSSDSVLALCDGLVPANSSDTTIPRMTWWNHLGTAEWVRGDFGTTSRVSQVSIYWYDDTGFGQCRVPQSWALDYLSGTNWVPVSGATSYGVARDTWNTVTFNPVLTTALRARVQLQSGVSGGILEMRIPYQQVSSLSSYYPLDGNANDVTAGLNGTLNGGTFVSDRFGNTSKALQFNGAGDYATIPRGIQMHWTIAFWVKTSATGGGNQWYNGQGLVDGEVAGITNDFGTALVGSQAAFGVGNPDTTITSTTKINDGQWHHVAATRDGTTGQMQLFVDGTLQASTLGPTGLRNTPSNLRLGSLQTLVPGGFFNGVLDEVRIYDRVLASGEIAALAGIPPSAPAGLTGSSSNGAPVTLMWLASLGATAYNVKRSTTSGGPYSTIATTTAASWTDTGVTGGTTYFYVVSALNNNVESPNSLEVSAPLQVIATTFSGTSIQLSGWGGSPGQTYYLLGSTNLLLPTSQWPTLLTNSFGTGGSFNVLIPSDPSLPQQFFRIQVP